MPADALNVLCAQLQRDLFAIAKFLFETQCRLSLFALDIESFDGELVFSRRNMPILLSATTFALRSTH